MFSKAKIGRIENYLGDVFGLGSISVAASAAGGGFLGAIAPGTVMHVAGGTAAMCAGAPGAIIGAEIGLAIGVAVVGKIFIYDELHDYFKNKHAKITDHKKTFNEVPLNTNLAEKVSARRQSTVTVAPTTLKTSLS